MEEERWETVEEFMMCQSCHERIPEALWKNKLPCPKCGHPYPYSITLWGDAQEESE